MDHRGWEQLLNNVHKYQCTRYGYTYRSVGAYGRNLFSFVFSVVFGVVVVVFRYWSLVWAQKDFFPIGSYG